MNILHHLRIGTRLGLGFTVIILLICGLAGFVYSELQGARQLAEEASHEQTERNNLAREWQEAILVNGQRTLAIVLSDGDRVQAEFKPLMQAQTGRTTQMQNRFAELETSPRGTELQGQLAAARKTYLALRETLFAARTAGDQEAVNRLLPEFKRLIALYVDAVRALTRYEDERDAITSKSVDSSLTFVLHATWITALVCVAVAAALGWALTRSIVRPVAQVQAAAERIAGGDLSAEIHTTRQDELGHLTRSLGDMQQALRTLVGSIRSSVDSISVASAEVATGNNDLSARTEQSAANIQQTASSVEEIASTVKHSADSARQADQLSRQASDIAAQGGEAVVQVVRAMDGIQASSQRISDIIGTIDGIAFQTNILALNAAVEAARAGEQGRGFAVVAGEVRSLAQRSAGAAKEIKALIGESVQRVENGSLQAAQAGRTLQEVVTSVQRVSDIVGEISSATQEQSQGLGEINTAVANLDRTTQQNAALVEESAAAASSLSDQAKILMSSIQRFKLPH